MKKIYDFAAAGSTPELVLCLPFDERRKSRLRTHTTSGEEIGLMLPRGSILRHGTLLRDESGRVIEVQAAKETVSTVIGNDPLLLTRAAYHLGNRHVPLQIGKGWLRYQHDHVLDAMVVGLGLQVLTGEHPFEPEDGAYAGHAHSHGHDHSHSHDDHDHHGHGHSHGHHHH